MYEPSFILFSWAYSLTTCPLWLSHFPCTAFNASSLSCSDIFSCLCLVDQSYSLANPTMNMEQAHPQPTVFEGELKSYQLKVFTVNILSLCSCKETVHGCSGFFLSCHDCRDAGPKCLERAHHCYSIHLCGRRMVMMMNCHCLCPVHQLSLTLPKILKPVNQFMLGINLFLQNHSYFRHLSYFKLHIL